MQKGFIDNLLNIQIKYSGTWSKREGDIVLAHFDHVFI
ncbi:hypothetical protein KIS4809_1506 [Bacillus sp. ZZV12-4809]|nr:hypothetical protein KIS4809_1506 [Bacillus sp. ZZV12-4809]